MKKIIKLKSRLAVIFLSAAVGLVFLGGIPVVTAESDNQCYGPCDDWGSGCFKVEFSDEDETATIPTPGGEIIESVAVKAGNSCFYYTEDRDDGCYAVSGLGTNEVTVWETGECHDISHVEFMLAGNLTPTPTETIMPTGTPVPTVTPDPTVTPTPTQTPVSTATPTQVVKDDDNDDGGSSESVDESTGDPTEEKQGQVLGASTLAATGNWQQSILSLINGFGLALTGLGLKLRGKKK